MKSKAKESVTMTIGERVLEILHSRGMSQKEFSEKTGIPQSTISDWKGKKLNPNSDKIMIICDVLNIDPAYLLTGSNKYADRPIADIIICRGTDEYEFLMEYRNLRAEGRDRLRGYLQALKDSQK